MVFGLVAEEAIVNGDLWTMEDWSEESRSKCESVVVEEDTCLGAKADSWAGAKYNGSDANCRILNFV